VLQKRKIVLHAISHKRDGAFSDYTLLQNTASLRTGRFPNGGGGCCTDTPVRGAALALALALALVQTGGDVKGIQCPGYNWVSLFLGLQVGGVSDETVKYGYGFCATRTI
jgi:hypothetical protein